MTHAFKLDEMKEIKVEGIEEYRDIPYENRSGKILMMDIFKPSNTDGIELPVIVNVPGGGLVMGSKENSAGFCKLLAKKVIWFFLWNTD